MLGLGYFYIAIHGIMALCIHIFTFRPRLLLRPPTHEPQNAAAED